MIVLSALIVFSSFIFVTHQITTTKVLTLFHGQPAYIEFKDMYPDAVESFTGIKVFNLKLIQTDEYANSLVLQMFFDTEGFRYSYAILCETQKPIRVQGAGFYHAMGYLSDNECLGK